MTRIFKRIKKINWKVITKIFILLFFIWLFITAYQIYTYPTNSSPQPTDVAIVLGAAVWNGQPSPVFEERVKHGIHLYKIGIVKNLIFTGGIGEKDTISEAEVARSYAIMEGVHLKSIFIETKSSITHENLLESCKLMHINEMKSAIIISDPMHMKRAMKIANDINMKASPSPTPSTKYKTWRSKSGFLFYELFFYMGHIISNTFDFVEKCSG